MTVRGVQESGRPQTWCDVATIVVDVVDLIVADVVGVIVVVDDDVVCAYAITVACAITHAIAIVLASDISLEAQTCQDCSKHISFVIALQIVVPEHSSFPLLSPLEIFVKE